jgi:adenosylcobinamide kinase / adenosylcobinamide-phosphate guanylyltransferase
VRKDQNKNVTLVLGGVRSGKSRHAQQLAERTDRVTFVATAEHRDDEEMRLKIERHRAERPAHWFTVEEPLHLCRVLTTDGPNCDLMLIDCLTLFASNLLEAFDDDRAQLENHLNQFCDALRSAACSVVLVSNEVGSGVVPAYELGRRFRDLAGEINQRVAACADHVYLMVAGLPLTLKAPLNAGGER